MKLSRRGAANRFQPGKDDALLWLLLLLLAPMLSLFELCFFHATSGPESLSFDTNQDNLVQPAPTWKNNAENSALLDYRLIMAAVDHRLVLSMPALVSAFSKKSFSSARSAIFSRVAVVSDLPAILHEIFQGRMSGFVLLTQNS